MAAAKSKGSVLEAGFGPTPRSYFAMSYPHPVQPADPRDERDVSVVNLPKDLEKFITDFVKDGAGYYIMNVEISTPQGNFDPYLSSNGTHPGIVWFVYRAGARIDSSWSFSLKSTNDYYGELGECLEDFEANQCGNLSYVAIGETPGCFFLRTTDVKANWHYRWGSKLPKSCHMALMRHIVGAPKEHPDDVDTKWVGGRIRAVTFGYNGTWVMYGSDWIDWGDESAMPPRLIAALKKSRENQNKDGWTVNKVKLNVRNPKEYILAYNNGFVYCAFHHSFAQKFEAVAKQWCDRKGVGYNPEIDYLENDDCNHAPFLGNQLTELPSNSMNSMNQSESSAPVRPAQPVPASPPKTSPAGHGEPHVLLSVPLSSIRDGPSTAPLPVQLYSSDQLLPQQKRLSKPSLVGKMKGKLGF